MKSPNLRIFSAGLALLTTLICWSLSAPLNSQNDEKYHIGSIWCANGNNEYCQILSSDSGIPLALIKADVCMPPNIEETYKRILVSRKVDGCRYEFKENDLINQIQDPRQDYTTPKSIATNFIGFPETTNYFKSLNIFVSSNTAFSVILMRIFNSSIFCVLLIAALILSEKKNKKIVCFWRYI